MPPFTHVLGPVVEAGDGKPQTRLIRRLSIVRSLIDQLPSSSYFHQHLNPSLDHGLALTDGLAFQERDFAVNIQYTFEIDCRQSLEEMWMALHLKTRQHIRRAEKMYSVRAVHDPKVFVEFYLKNIEARGRINFVDFASFPAVFSESRRHECGIAIGAFQNGAPIAMTYLVWGHGMMYYLLSTRTLETHDHGAVSLLLWTAIKEAHELGLILDFDGVCSRGTARFMSNFGGSIKTLLSVRRSAMAYFLQDIKKLYSRDETYRFTNWR
jgi:hypothetical protein